MFRTHPQTPLLLHHSLTACFAGFARQRSYGYISLQELANQSRQAMLRERKEFGDGF